MTSSDEKNPSPREFYEFFRAQFGYLETDDGLPSNSSIMSSFCERIPRAGYSWARSCGYRNAHLSFELDWDVYDSLFQLTVMLPEGERKSASAEVGFRIEEILATFGVDAQAGDRIDSNQGMKLVMLYATAIRPHAREIFVPRVKPSNGFSGFSWYAKVKAAKSKVGP